jgi:hypothetical protein
MPPEGIDGEVMEAVVLWPNVGVAVAGALPLVPWTTWTFWPSAF